MLGGVVPGVVRHQSEIQRQQPNQPPGCALANLSLSANRGHFENFEFGIANCEFVDYNRMIRNSKSAIRNVPYVPLVKLLSHFTRFNRSKSDSILPVPNTTEASGSSARETGRPVSIDSLLSRFFNNAPPPVSTMPRSTMSAESSGGVRSSATRTALIIVETESPRASRISSSVMVIVFGIPSIKLRPRTSNDNSSSSGNAEPNSILIASAVRSPISKLYFRLMYCVIASSISFPATRTDFE